MSEDAPAVGDVLADVEVGPIAHGGHWVARHEGRVVFVRHALAGERVVVRLTGVAKRHAFGDAIAVVEASPHRVEEPCAIAATCGGCDFQHVEVAHQRELKRQVVAEQLRRLAGIAWDGEVEGVDPDAFGWRTRMRYRRGADGWGLRRTRSHDVATLPAVGCLIAAPALAAPPPDAGGDEIIGVDGPQGPVWVAPGAETLVTAQAAGRSWRVRADGFWQVHPRAADTLVAAVLDGVRPVPSRWPSTSTAAWGCSPAPWWTPACGSPVSRGPARPSSWPGATCPRRVSWPGEWRRCWGGGPAAAARPRCRTGSTWSSWTPRAPARARR